MWTVLVLFEIHLITWVRVSRTLSHSPDALSGSWESAIALLCFQLYNQLSIMAIRKVIIRISYALCNVIW